MEAPPRQAGWVWFGVTLAAAGLIYLLGGSLVPFLFGAALAFVLDPAVARLERWHLPRGWAAASACILVFGLLALLAYALPNLTAEISRLAEQLPDLVERLQIRLRAWGILAEATRPESADIAKAAGQILKLGFTLLDIGLLVIVTPFVTFYLLRDWPRVMASARSLVPRQSAPTVFRLTDEMAGRLAGFLRGQGLVVLIEAIGITLGLVLIGLDYAVLVGMLTGLSNFIPVIGNLTMFLIAFGLAIVQFEEMGPPLMVALLFAAVQTLDTTVLSPWLVGHRVHLHPVWVIFALLVGGSLFGFVGALLAMPMAAVGDVLVRFLIRRYRGSDLYEDG